ncbi:MAG TPA: LCCL domain-containing protein [Myxococcaceae bacterium]|nr:LCCL domain-containing protein [Myxococcaceae bacterium]
MRMRRLIAVGLFAALALACGGAPGRVIGWSDNLPGIEPSATLGEVYAFSCPGGGQTGATVWGTDLYTDDSAICPAAVHAGKLSAYGGGTATLEVMDGRQSYTGSTRNGVTSLDFGAWPGSIQFR